MQQVSGLFLHLAENESLFFWGFFSSFWRNMTADPTSTTAMVMAYNALITPFPMHSIHKCCKIVLDWMVAAIVSVIKSTHTPATQCLPLFTTHGGSSLS